MDPIVKVPIRPDSRRRGCDSSGPGRPALVPASLCFSKQPPGKASSTNNSPSQDAEAGTATGWGDAVVIAHNSSPSVASLGIGGHFIQHRATEQPLPYVPDTRHDRPGFVQIRIDASGVDGEAAVPLPHSLESWTRGQGCNHS